MKNKIICKIEDVDIVQEKPYLEFDWRALSAIGIHVTGKQLKKIKRLVKHNKIRKAQKLVLKIIDDWEKYREHQFEYIKSENKRMGIKEQ
ncbi:MAG: hypothetical protein PHG61_07185 [Candidatus Marinimicrobia bacterium]|jgi:Zn-finger domain-containing protein|nr:hypothetical protein [Candidatus Neomarinimicrobiota bacterium]